MKIAYIGIKGLPSRAGADRVVEAIVGRLSRPEYKPFVYSSAKQVPKGTRLDGIELIRIPTLPGKHLRPTSLFLLSALHSLILGNYDLIHLHNVEACFVLPLLRLRYRVISTSHGTFEEMDGWSRMSQWLMKLTEYPFIYLSNLATCVSLPMAGEYQNKYRRKVHHIPNGIDASLEISRFAAVTNEAIRHFSRRDYILFAAARIIPSKGCHLLLEAFSRLDEDIGLLVVGNSSLVPAYEQQLKELADGRVLFAPLIASKRELYSIIGSSRLFIHPTVFEAMSVILLEVASLGTPIIASDIPAITSILPGRALYFESGNSDDLTEKLNWALKCPDDMHQLAVSAKNWVAANYSWDEIVPEYEALYRAAIN